MPADFAPLIRSLNGHKVEYVIVGGMAAVVLGVPIVTRDFDLCYRQSRDNAARLAGALAPFHPRLRGVDEPVPFRFDAATIQMGCNFTLSTDVGDVDALGHLSGLGGYEQIINSAEQLPMFGEPVFVMSLEDLVKAKQAAGRTKDKLQLIEIEATLRLRKKLKPND